MATKTETPRTPDVACEIDAKAFTLSLTFRDRPEPVIFDATTLAPEVQNYAMMHGLKQRLVDAAAIPRDPDTGKSATVTDKWNAIMAVIETLRGGEWSARREGGGNEGGLLLRALVVLYPAKTREELAAWVGAKSKSEQAALRANPKVAAAIAELRAAAAKGVDSDAILGELE